MLSLAGMSSITPQIEQISREQFTTFIGSKPIVVLHIQNYTHLDFMDEIAIHFQSDYHNSVRFGCFDHTQVLGYREWKLKHFGQFCNNERGYFLFVNGKCAAFHDGTSEDSSERAADNITFLGSAIASFAFKTKTPLEAHMNVSEHKKAERIVSCFEKALAKNPPTFKHETPSEKTEKVFSTLKRRTPYEILGITQNASQEEIKAAYHKKMNESHPDKVAQLSEGIKRIAEQETQEIRSAYDQLRSATAQKH